MLNPLETQKMEKPKKETLNVKVEDKKDSQKLELLDAQEDYNWNYL